MTREYRDQISPVAARDVDCGILNFSAGRDRSPIPAITKPCNLFLDTLISNVLNYILIDLIDLTPIELTHLKIGAQKNTVFGPVGVK